MNLKTFFHKPQAVIKLHITGAITGKSLEKLSKDLSKASFFTPLALALVVNSPGGSAAHSSLIFHRIQSFARLHHIPVLAFAEDMAASGGYYIMCAGESLYASSPLSLIGSIGALSSFITVKALVNRYGIEGRNWTSSPKDIRTRLNPMEDLGEEAKRWMQGMLGETNTEFQRVVTESRKGRLTVVEGKRGEVIFNGDVFNVEEAVGFGLIDGIAGCDEVIGGRFPKARVVEVSKESRVEKIINSLYR